MSRLGFSCKDCTERYVGCHSNCEKYQLEWEINEKRKKDLKVKREINKYTNDAISERVGKEAIRKKRAGWYGRSMD